MKKIKIYLILFLLGLLFFILKSGSLLDNSIFTFSTANIPYPSPTAITDTKNQIRIGVEKVVKESYYITYSKIEGNPSHFATYLIIENLKKEKLSPKDYKEIWLVDNLGTRYEPLPYFKISDFPKDQPLGWKLMLFNKFPSVDNKASFVTIYVKFQNNTFELEKVKLP